MLRNLLRKLFGKNVNQPGSDDQRMPGRTDQKAGPDGKSTDKITERNQNIGRPETGRELGKPQRRENRNETDTKRTPDKGRAPDKQKESVPKKVQWRISEYVVPVAEGKKRFLDFDLPVEVMHAISDLGFQYCTPIQEGILPTLLEGRDAAGRAQTGTGKTAAFLISIITHLLRNPVKQPHRKSPRVLILAPTRELAMQIKKDADGLSKYADQRIVAVLGGIEYKEQRDFLAGERIDIVVATPGRLLDFKKQGSIHLDRVEILIIDEADRMLDMGFIPDVRRIIESTPPKSKRQTVLFSATLTPEVNRLASSWTREHSLVEIEPENVVVKTIKQVFYLTTDLEKFKILYNLIAVRGLQRVLVFANRKDTARKLKDHLSSHGLSCALLSGDVEQARRIKRLEDFRAGKIKVLVATDVAARGLHIEGISHVVNFTLPENPEDYVHRIGRTGRAGASGIAISFATESDSYFVPAIKQFLGEDIPSTYPEDDLLTPLPEPKFPLPRREAHERRYQRGGAHHPHQGGNRGNKRSFKR